MTGSPRKGRVLGVDYGTRRVGLALSDSARTVALPYRTLPAGPQLLDAIAAVVEREGVVEVVVGLPLGLRGQETERTREVRAFAEKLQARLGIPVHLVDERLTSLEAERRLREAGRKPSREKHRVDQVAAMLILESFLRSDRL